jgi:AP-4 complex subunit mu-1
LFNASGYVINSSIEGCIQMKSYLSGNPDLRIALNDDLVVGKNGYSGSVVLDDCNFNECADITNFERSRVLKVKPPEGIKYYFS